MNKFHYLVRRMEARGLPLHRILQGSGICEREFADVNFFPSVVQYRIVIRNIVENSPPGIGISLGSESRTSEGVLGYATLSSSCIRDANLLLKKYFPLVERFTTYDDEVTDTAWEIKFSTVYAMGDATPFLIEELCARAQAQFHWYTNVQVSFNHLSFAYPEPPYVHLYRDHFQCPLSFNQPGNIVSMDKKIMDLPIVLSNPDVCRLCEEQCNKLMGAHINSRSLGADIRRRLVLNPGSFPSFNEISHLMGMSEANLRRRLRDEGESYRTIVEDVRKGLALQYLSETRLTAKQIAYYLGFSNVHNFRRAFKEWTGLYPSAYQRNGND